MNQEKTTGKQLKRDFKKFLTASDIECKATRGYIQISKFFLTFTANDGYVTVWTPAAPFGLTSMSFPYIDAHSFFCKILYYHMRLHGKGLRVNGKIRTLKNGKVKQYFQ